MKVDRISYSKLLPTGVYANERIGLEAELNSGDDAEISMDILRNMVEQFHKKYNPQYYQPNTHILGGAVEPQSVAIENIDKIDAFIEVINSKYMTKNALEKMKPQVEKENDERLTEAFQKRLNELS